MKRVPASYFLIPVMALALLPTYHSRAFGEITPDELAPLGLEFSWTAQSVLNRQRDVIRHVVNDENNVYVQSSAGVITALDANTGRRLWAKQLGRNDEFSFQVVSNADLLIVITGPVVRAVDKFTGEVLFEYRLKRSAAAAPLVSEDKFYVPEVNGSLYAYSIDVLEYLERYDTLPPRVAQKYDWRFISNDRTQYSAVMANDHICFASDSRNLHSVSPDGKTQFQIFLNARPSAPLAIDESPAIPHVIVATESDEVFSFELDKGRRGWSFPVERAVKQKPFVHDGRIYVVMEQTGVTAISSETGRHVQVPDSARGADGDATTRWFVPGILSIAAVTEDHIYGIDRDRRLIAIRQDNAACTASALVASYAVPHTNSVTDRLFLVSSYGEVVCLKPQGSEFATYLRRPDRQPIDVDVLESDEPADGGEIPEDE